MPSATVRFLGRLTSQPGGQTTRGRLETRVYGVTATLVRVRRESDSDYHLVLQNGGASLIAEMPFAGCDRGARDRRAMMRAKGHA
jgi:hypothetical protein